MNPKLSLVVAIFLPLLLAPLIPLLGRRIGRWAGWVAFLFPVLSTGALLNLLFQLEPGTQHVVEWDWVPLLGINFSFLVDGLSLFFGLIVSGMGVLIFFYANFYLDDHYKHRGRFYGYLTLFMAAMLGTVLANHLVLLFIFWELTGIASFLLIGFLHEERVSRVGARQALLVTAGTGLILLIGVIMLGQIQGEYSLAKLLAGGGDAPADAGLLMTVAMVLVMIGAFGKSAQVPFHFWLPNAMAAPTPVSAYLHSATMVKLGIFLAARVFPIFVENGAWAQLLIPVGFTTMALGAVFALLSHDLKAILAYSTVSALGSFTGYYGLGLSEGVTHDFLHILNHVFYKGCLFMVVGIVTHATGLRDIRKLGGLYRRMPLLGLTCLLAALSMAGIPGTLGFISKEALLVEVIPSATLHGGLGTYALVMVLVASTAKVAFSTRLFFNIFTGPEPAAIQKHFHAPGLAMQLPPLLLALGALIFGLYPAGLEPLFHHLAVPGLNPHPAHLAIWHGLNGALFTGLGMFALGGLIYLWGQKTGWRWARIPGALRVDLWFEGGLALLSRSSRVLVQYLRYDRPLDYLPLLAGFIVVVLGGFFWKHYGPGGEYVEFWSQLSWPQFGSLRIFVALLMSLAVLGVVLLSRWTTQLISLSVMGFLVTFYFVLYRAPDLALTQILVDTASLILILILLGRFPKQAEEGEIEGNYPLGRRLFNVLVSVGVGGVITMFILVVTAQPGPDRIGQRFLDTTLELAKGSNAVNTILVDYRGLDTLFEITVLFIAMLACLGLVTRFKRSDRHYREGAVGLPQASLEREEEQR